MKRALGLTSEKIFPIGLGAMPLSLSGRPSESQAMDVILAAIDMGVDFIDTANVYCIDDNDIGHNERLLAKCLLQRPTARVLVATKGGLKRPSGQWVTDGKPVALRNACERSLKDLGIEQIFLYQLHAPDSQVPLEDSVGELALLKEEGKVLHLGLSNVSKNEIDRAQKIVRFETVQNRFNPLCQRDLFNGVIDACHHHQMSYIAYSPVGGHFLNQELSKHELLLEIATKYAVTTYQVMLAWCLEKDKSTIAIPGASRVKSISDSFASLKVQLSTDDVQAIDDITMMA